MAHRPERQILNDSHLLDSIIAQLGHILREQLGHCVHLVVCKRPGLGRHRLERLNLGDGVRALEIQVEVGQHHERHRQLDDYCVNPHLIVQH